MTIKTADSLKDHFKLNHRLYIIGFILLFLVLLISYNKGNESIIANIKEHLRVVREKSDSYPKEHLQLAEEYLVKAINRKKMDSHLYLLAGEVYYYKRDIQTAESYYDELSTLKLNELTLEEYTLFAYRLAEISLLKNDFKGQEKYLQIAFRIDPDLKILRENIFTRSAYQTLAYYYFYSLRDACQEKNMEKIKTFYNFLIPLINEDIKKKLVEEADFSIIRNQKPIE